MMKNLINKLKFIFRFAYKNIIYTKFQSFILLLSITIVTTLTIIAFSIRSFVYQYTYQYYFSQYGDYDIEMTLEDNAQARFFSIRHLRNFDSEKINNFSSFFEFKTILKKDDNYTYVNVLASSIEELKKISTINVTKLKDDEVIISKEISKNLKINRNNYINLQIGSEKLAFKVIAILDSGLINDQNIFVNKNAVVNKLLQLIAPEIGHVDPLIIANLYNKVYLKINDDYDIEEVISELNTINEYQNLKITPLINLSSIDKFVTSHVSVIYLLIIFILIAILFIMKSTIQIVFLERKKQISVINILGGKKIFSFLVIFMEMVIYFIIASILSYYIVKLILILAIDILELKVTYTIKLDHLMFSLGFDFLFFSLFLIISYIKMNKKSEKKIVKWENITFFISILLFIIMQLLKGEINIEYFSLFILLSCFIFAFSSSIIILSLIPKIRRRNQVFYLTIGNRMYQNIHNRRSLNVLLILFITIIIFVGIKKEINETITTIEEAIKVDYAITHITTNYNKSYQELSEDEKIDEIDKALLYQNVFMKDIEEPFQYFISIEDFKPYFDLSQEVLEKLESTEERYIILPQYLHYIFHYQIGDEIKITINHHFENESFLIAGFYDLPVKNYLLSNMIKFEDYEANAIFIKANDKQEVKHKIIDEYSKYLYYILDFDEQFYQYSNSIMKIINYVSFMIVIIILCFTLSIFNNLMLLFYDVKNIYARIMVLGCSKNKLIKFILFERLILLAIIIVIVSMLIPFIDNYLWYLLIFFKSYLNLKISIISVIVGLGLAIIIYLLSSIYYLSKIKTINLAKEISVI